MVVILTAIGLVAIALGVARAISPRSYNPQKGEAYECGIPTRGNYELTSTGVKTEGDCDFCFACIHNCPQKAIQFQSLPDDPLLARGEVNPNARYRNEHVSLWSIKESNRQ